MAATTEQTNEAQLLGVSAVLFAGSTTLTIVWCASMSAMGMPMPGGWTMSMAWMRMPGQTWLGAGTSFLGMWIVMMVAMMLPSLVPMLGRYRQAVSRAGATRLGPLTAIVGAGYCFVWTVVGMAVFPVGVTLAEVEMRQPALARAVPLAVGVVVLLAGALQFSAWKERYLAGRRESPASARAGVGAGHAEVSPIRLAPAEAVRHGLRLGLHSSSCFRVFFLSDGTATADMPGATAAELQKATLATLGFLFAQVLTVGEMKQKIMRT